MKFLSKITCLVLALGFVVALSSCGKDDDTCYECEYTGIDPLTFCEGDDDGNGGTISSSALEAGIEDLEDDGWTCTKQ